MTLAPTPSPYPIPSSESVIGTIQRLTLPKLELGPTRTFVQYKDAFNLVQKANKTFSLYTSPVETSLGSIFENLQKSEKSPEYLQALFGYVDNLTDLYQLLVQSDNYSPIIFHLAKNGGHGEHFWESVGNIMFNPKNKTEEQIRDKAKEIIDREDQDDVLRTPNYRIALRKMAEVLAADSFMKQYPQYTGDAAPVFRSILALRQS